MSKLFNGQFGLWVGKLIMLVSPVLLGACASSGQLLGASSPVASLGAPLIVKTQLGSLAVWDTGPRSDGPTIVLWPSIFSDHVIYESLVKRWSGKRRLILIDGPGHGASDGPEAKTFSMQDCAVAMQQVLDSRSIERAVVGGTSWGGLVGAEFALLYPQRTQALIMMNTPFFVSPDGPSIGERLITWGAGNLLGTHLFTDGVARSFFLPSTREAASLPIRHFHHSLHRSDSAKLSNAIASVLIERVALADRLPRIQAPTLVIAGSKDDMYPLEMQREATRRLPKGRLELVDSKHISVVDRPDEVAELVDGFLNALQK